MTLLHMDASAWSSGWPRRTGLLPVAPVSVGLHDERPIGGSHELQDLRAHHAAWGPRPSDSARDAERLLESMAEVALSGRGGAHFPVAVKWRAVLAAGGGGTVVANAAEGEPASAKDGVLLRARPHLFLDGLATAAEVLGATDVVIWLHGGSTDTHRVLHHALAERRAARLPELPMRIVRAPDSYLSGEGNAVVRALSGGPALPGFAVLPAATVGVHGRPTLVQNAETLTRIAVLSRTGAEDYAPSALLTVVGGGRRTVLERPTTSTVAAAVAAAGNLLSSEPQAVLLGGYGGAWLSWEEAADLPVDEPTLRAAGASIGAGVVAPLPFARLRPGRDGERVRVPRGEQRPSVRALPVRAALHQHRADRPGARPGPPPGRRAHPAPRRRGERPRRLPAPGRRDPADGQRPDHVRRGRVGARRRAPLPGEPAGTSAAGAGGGLTWSCS